MHFSRLLILGTLLLTATGVATVVPRMSLADIAGSSERVVHAVVSKKWSAWDNSHRYIWTHYELAVRDTLKGPVGARFVISEPGGMVDGIGMRVSGAPEFQVGEEIIVFAYQTPIDYWRVRGYSQGSFRVGADSGPESGGVRLVTPMESAGLKLIGPDQPTIGPTARRPLELSAFKSQVRTLIRLSTEVR